jgi:hypothetical protein
VLSIQLVRKPKGPLLQDELPVMSHAGENNSDLSLKFGLTEELKKAYFVFIFLDMQERGLTK